MKTLLLLALLVLLNAACAQDQNHISFKDIEGLWYVNLSNFAMWLKGDKLNPRFNYTIVNEETLLDEVSFEKNGKTKQIIGYDTRDKKDQSTIIWKGKGILSLFKSNWQIIHYNSNYQIVLLSFEKIAFTRAGYDVISRSKKLSAAALVAIKNVLSKLNLEIELTEIK